MVSMTTHATRMRALTTACHSFVVQSDSGSCSNGVTNLRDSIHHPLLAPQCIPGDTISVHSDNCKCGASRKLMRKLFQNAAVRLLAACTGFQSDSASSSRFVHRSLSGHALSFLADDCCLLIEARPGRQRSADDTRGFYVSRTCTNFGDRALGLL